MSKKHKSDNKQHGTKSGTVLFNLHLAPVCFDYIHIFIHTKMIMLVSLQTKKKKKEKKCEICGLQKLPVLPSVSTIFGINSPSPSTTVCTTTLVCQHMQLCLTVNVYDHDYSSVNFSPQYQRKWPSKKLFIILISQTLFHISLSFINVIYCKGVL